MVPCDYAFLHRWRYNNFSVVRQYVCLLNGADFIFPIPLINLFLQCFFGTLIF